MEVTKYSDNCFLIRGPYNKETNQITNIAVKNNTIKYKVTANPSTNVKLHFCNYGVIRKTKKATLNQWVTIELPTWNMIDGISGPHKTTSLCFMGEIFNVEVK